MYDQRVSVKDDVLHDLILSFERVDVVLLRLDVEGVFWEGDRGTLQPVSRPYCQLVSVYCCDIVL